MVRVVEKQLNAGDEIEGIDIRNGCLTGASLLE
jgi:hypothetical protein